jgi:hypothetical protein
MSRVTWLLALLIAGLAQADEPDLRLAVDLPVEIRAWFRNPDGSCVQCSLGMCGVDQNCPAAATLLWDTEYGPRERGGSGPSRVAEYCRRRGIRAWNVTGETTWDWMRWATATGRGAAIGAGSNHFQTLMGHDAKQGLWYVCNNNSPGRIDTYSDAAFRRLHLASGPWVVVLDSPPHPARPRYLAWW